jgi:hypothetical protein
LVLLSIVFFSYLRLWIMLFFFFSSALLTYVLVTTFQSFPFLSITIVLLIFSQKKKKQLIRMDTGKYIARTSCHYIIWGSDYIAFNYKKEKKIMGFKGRI